MRLRRLDPYVESMLKRAELEISAFFMDFGEGIKFLDAFASALDEAASFPESAKDAGRGAKVFYVEYRGFRYGVIFLYNDSEIFLSDIFNTLQQYWFPES